MDSLAQRIGEVPKLYEQGDKSTACLLKDAGFLERRDVVRVEDVERVLEEKPELAKLWLARRRDQRVAGGWGIEHERDAWRVQSFSGAGTFAIRDKERALAEFIVRYVGFIGDVLERSP